MWISSVSTINMECFLHYLWRHTRGYGRYFLCRIPPCSPQQINTGTFLGLIRWITRRAIAVSRHVSSVSFYVYHFGYYFGDPNWYDGYGASYTDLSLAYSLGWYQDAKVAIWRGFFLLQSKIYFQLSYDLPLVADHGKTIVPEEWQSYASAAIEHCNSWVTLVSAVLANFSGVKKNNIRSKTLTACQHHPLLIICDILACGQSCWDCCHRTSSLFCGIECRHFDSPREHDDTDRRRYPRRIIYDKSYYPNTLQKRRRHFLWLFMTSRNRYLVSK